MFFKGPQCDCSPLKSPKVATNTISLESAQHLSREERCALAVFLTRIQRTWFMWICVIQDGLFVISRAKFSHLLATLACTRSPLKRELIILGFPASC